MSKKLFLLSFFLNTFVFGQSIYEPVYNSSIYDFLERLSNKNIIELFTDIRTITRQQIAEKLIQIDEQIAKLTSIEKERLDFYKKEYAFEIMHLEKKNLEISEFFSSKETGRFNLFKFYSEKFSLVADPVIGLEYNLSNEVYHQYGGIQLLGRISDNWGFYFNYRDNTETGNNINRKKDFSPETGTNMLKNEETLIDYSETRGGISYGWDWGNLTAAKDFINIGSSSQSSIILSHKPPSFPFIRLEIFPTNWFRYNFIHGWLNSNLIDSSTIRYTGVEATVLPRSLSYSRLFKYYVSHTFSFQPFNNWWLSLGESIIYGDKLEFIYFLPVFYRLADHYNSASGYDTGDNAQIFFNTSYIVEKLKSKFYASVYIDELSITDLFSGGDNAQVWALTLGGKFTNPLWENNYLNLEYTAIKPYAYMNGDPLHQYTSSGYQLGHWIGSNAEQFYLEMEQYLPFRINLKTYFNYVVKGEKEDINNYYNKVVSTYPLLWRENSYYSEIGAKISYNPMHDLFFEIFYSNVFKSTGRFKDEYNLNTGSFITASLRYGI